MNDLLEELSFRGPNARLVLMPISRVLVEEDVRLGDFRIYPPGKLVLQQLRPVQNFSVERVLADTEGGHLLGQQLREACTSLTGFDLDVLSRSALVAFITDVEWDTFLGASHDDDIELLQRLSATAERAMDIVRFEFCRLDLPATLPGVVGSWEGSGPYLGALLYCLQDHESYLVAGEASGYAVISSGIGLDLGRGYLEPLPSASDGEVGAVVVHALSLLSDAMYSRNDTSKFLRTMTLLEYLANPDDYQRWTKSKGEIACHSANDKGSYLRISNRLHQITAIKDASGTELGYRTLIIHHGKFLEDVIPDRRHRRALFAELFTYASVVMKDMLERVELTWDQFTEYRRELKVSLGVV